MKTKVTTSSCEIVFSLPQWTADERFDYTKQHYFHESHAWAGSYDRSSTHNMLDDALFKTVEYEELCLHPQSQWIKCEVSLQGDIKQNIQAMQQKIENVLSQWRDFQPKQED